MDCLLHFLPEKATKSRPTELISGDGEFNAAGFKDFLNSVKLHEGDSKYAVVAIMGPQSSGKSTLMNKLFSTNFREMNAQSGRNQTTKGIWLARATNIMEPLIVVLDMEGTDGLERGEDDTAFEKQSALFALAVSDIVLINMWCHDIGREQAANRPLLKTIFEVMMQLFSPRKTTLLFVIRDKTKTPFEKLESKLREDVLKIWKAAPKPRGRENTPLNEIFNVGVTALSSYEYIPDKFEHEVAQLRSQYFDSIYARSQELLPFRSAKKIWDIIKEYKDLDLPPHKVMVATVRCEEIAMDKLRLFKSDKDWLALQEKAKAGLVRRFGAQISSILSRYLIEYDSESMHFVEDVRNAKRPYLESEILKLVHPAYMNTLDHLRLEASRSFETLLKALLSEGEGFAEYVRICHQSCVLQFDQQCSDHATIKQANWDWEYASIVGRELRRDIENHANVVRTEKLPQIVGQQRERLCSKLSKKLKYLVTEPSDKDMWASIRSVMRSESDAAALALPSAVATFQVEKAEVEQMVDDLKQSARKLVETKFIEDTQDIMGLMKSRFIWALSTMESAPSAEQAKEEAYRQCLKFLSMAAVIRLDEREDNVERVLFSALMGADCGVDHLASTSWEEVPPEMTLITPVKCREIWDQFKKDMKRHIDDTNKVKEHCEKENIYGSLATWAILGVVALGVAAFVVLIRVANIDVGLAIAAAGVAGGAMVVDGIYTYMDKEAKVFRKKHRKLLRRLKLCLNEIYNILMAVMGQRSALAKA